MCGRYTSITPVTDLARYVGVDEVSAEDADPRYADPRYNVAPTEEVPAVAVSGGRRTLGMLRWGLVPPWADDPRVGSRMINARSESVLDKPAFRRAYSRRRCLMPADGFYEWRVEADGSGRRPWYFRHTRDEPLALAGVWESWRSEDDRSGARERLVSCAILTTTANPTVAPVHHRMPVVIEPEAWEAWLDPEVDGAELRHLLAPAPAGLLQATPVRPLVNAVANDGPALIEPSVG